jgi:hypothetical protein
VDDDGERYVWREPERPDLPLLTLDRGKPEDPTRNQNVVRIRWYRGHGFVDMRSIFRHPETGETRITKRGLTVRRGELDEVIQALTRAREILDGREQVLEPDAHM